MSVLGKYAANGCAKSDRHDLISGYIETKEKTFVREIRGEYNGTFIWFPTSK